VQVRDLAATTLSGMLKGTDGELAKAFREQSLAASLSFQGSTIGKNRYLHWPTNALPLRRTSYVQKNV
jgi:hypothetical protein